MDEKLKLITDLESMETVTMYSTFTAIIGKAISSATSSRYTGERREYKGKELSASPVSIMDRRM